MTTTKRIIAIILLALCVFLFSCGAKNESAKTDVSEQITATDETAAEETTEKTVIYPTDDPAVIDFPNGFMEMIFGFDKAIDNGEVVPVENTDSLSLVMYVPNYLEETGAVMQTEPCDLAHIEGSGGAMYRKGRELALNELTLEKLEGEFTTDFMKDGSEKGDGYELSAIAKNQAGYEYFTYGRTYNDGAKEGAYVYVKISDSYVFSFYYSDYTNRAGVLEAMIDSIIVK